MLNLCNGKTWVNIELKPNQSLDVVFNVTDMIENKNMFGGCCVSSFDHKFLGVAEELTKGQLEIGYLYESSKESPLPSIDYITSHGHTANLCMLDANEDIAKALHKKGMGYMLWTTSAIRKEYMWYKKCTQAGADILCVNYPHLLLKFLSRDTPITKI